MAGFKYRMNASAAEIHKSVVVHKRGKRVIGVACGPWAAIGSAQIDMRAKGLRLNRAAERQKGHIRLTFAPEHCGPEAKRVGIAVGGRQGQSKPLGNAQNTGGIILMSAPLACCNVWPQICGRLGLIRLSLIWRPLFRLLRHGAPYTAAACSPSRVLAVTGASVAVVQ